MPRPALLAALLAAVLAAGCDSGGRPREAAAPYRTPPHVAGPLLRRSIFNGSDSLQLPTDVAVTRDYVAVLNARPAPALYVLRRSDGALLAQVGGLGEGPGEFTVPWSVQAIPGGNQVWVHDVALLRATRLDLDGELRGGRSPRPSVSFAGGPPAFAVAWLPDGSAVGAGLLPAGRVARYEGGRMTATFGPLPPAERGTPPTVAQHAYQATMALHPAGTRLVLATRHADQVEIYDTRGGAPVVGRGPARFDPVYTVRRRFGQPAMEPGERQRFGYVDVAATDRHVIALYSGQSHASQPGAAHLGRSLHVFDWSGRFLGAVRLDSYLLHVAVDAERGRLYATRLLPTPAVVSYPLDAVLRGAKAMGGD